MCTKVEEDLIRQEAGMWMQRGKSFTSVDISNAIKQRGTFIKNRDVANFLRNTAVGMSLQYSLDPYRSSVINVQLPNGSWVEASLYHPQSIDASDYKNVKQKALSPDEAKNDNPFSADKIISKSDLKDDSDEKYSKEDESPPKITGIRDLVAGLQPRIGRIASPAPLVFNIEYVEHLHIHMNN